MMITYKVQERFVKANEDFDEMKIPLKTFILFKDQWKEIKIYLTNKNYQDCSCQLIGKYWIIWLEWFEFIYYKSSMHVRKFQN
jgi:hypothetical protein